MSSSDKKKPLDLVDRGHKGRSLAGTIAFVGSRAIEPLLQYGIMAQGVGTSLITTLGGRVLPQCPPIVSPTPFDRLALSLYRSILFSMSIGAMLKQNFHMLAIVREGISVGAGLIVGLSSAVYSSLNALSFVCAQTSASVNGEQFPQTPLVVGSIMYAVGLFPEYSSGVQKAAWKQDARNKGKIYSGALFGLSRKISYSGYTLWDSDYTVAAAGRIWDAFMGGLFTLDFT